MLNALTQQLLFHTIKLVSELWAVLRAWRYKCDCVIYLEWLTSKFQITNIANWFFLGLLINFCVLCQMIRHSFLGNQSGFFFPPTLPVSWNCSNHRLTLLIWGCCSHKAYCKAHWTFINGFNSTNHNTQWFFLDWRHCTLHLLC